MAAALGCTGAPADGTAAPSVATLITTVEGADDELRVATLPEVEGLFERASAVTAGKPRKSVVVGNMDELTCFKQLKKLKIPHVKATGAAKIEQPIIVTGAIDGVHFDTGRPYKERTIATGDAIDCRLAVSLHDLAKVVKKHGITTVLVKSFHRPNQAILDANAPLRHRIGFAIDIAGFKTKKGQIWNVKDDFHGKIGQQTCGQAAALPDPDTKVARALWATFCEIGATEAFDSGISPNYNASHFDHVHFDLTTDHPILFFP
ncbi:MAG: hypothetical protein NVSMB47_14280 [Polyangiales bacterium]